MLNLSKIGALVCAGALGCVAQANAQSWSLTEIGSLGGSGRTWANSINNARQIVGSSPTSSGDSHAFLYSHGTMRDLGTLGSGTGSNAVAINNRGQIVGSSATGETNYYGRAMVRPFVHDGTNMHAIATEGFASDISDNGLVTGTASSQPGVFRAALYDSGTGTLTQLDYPDLDWSSGYAVNSRGQIVGGFSSYSSDSDAFFYDAQSGQTSTIDLAGYNHLLGVDINEAGQVIGTAYDTRSGGNYSTAFLYQDGINTALTTPYGLGSAAAGINSAGDIVGSFQIDGDLENGTWHAFFYGSDGWVDLNDGVTLANGAYLYRAVALNDMGDIIAYGTDGSNWLLSTSPAPEPETWAMLLGGIAALRLIRRRR